MRWMDGFPTAWGQGFELATSSTDLFAQIEVVFILEITSSLTSRSMNFQYLFRGGGGGGTRFSYMKGQFLKAA